LASKEQHLSKALDNQGFAESLETSNRAQREWGLIIRFYSAVHYMEAYLSVVSRDSTGHADRRRLIRERRELAAIEAPFQDLYNLAWAARYLCLPCPLRDVLRAHDILIAVRRHIEGLL
jgi:hypothetical protein